MRKTLATLLLGSSLLTANCSKKDKLSGGAPMTEEALDQATTSKNSASAGSGYMAKEAQAYGVVAASPVAKGDMTSAESYKDYGKNPWVEAAKDHLSTFAADVDTASYTIARRKLATPSQKRVGSTQASNSPASRKSPLAGACSRSASCAIASIASCAAPRSRSLGPERATK